MVAELTFPVGVGNLRDVTWPKAISGHIRMVAISAPPLINWALGSNDIGSTLAFGFSFATKQLLSDKDPKLSAFFCPSPFQIDGWQPEHGNSPSQPGLPVVGVEGWWECGWCQTIPGFLFAKPKQMLNH